MLLGNIEFGLTRDKGFFAIDHARRIANYAYPTSPYANKAKRFPEKVAREMLKDNQAYLSDAAREERYQHICKAR